MSKNKDIREESLDPDICTDMTSFVKGLVSPRKPRANNRRGGVNE
jgi:hypothetical protein